MDELNLIPVDIRFVTRWTRRRIILVVAIPFLVAVAVTTAVQLRAVSVYSARLRGSDVELDRLMSKRREMTEIIKEVERISQRSGDLTRMVSIMDSYISNRILWSEVIQDLSNENLPGLCLASVQIVEDADTEESEDASFRKKLTLSGSTVNTRSMAGLLSFMEDYPLFNNVMLYEGELEVAGGRDVYRFTITCEVAR